MQAIQKIIKILLIIIFITDFIFISIELSLMYLKYKGNYIDKNEFREKAIYNKSQKGSIILLGCSFFHNCFLDESKMFHKYLSEFSKRNVYNLALGGGSPKEALYILRSYEQDIELNTLIDNDTHIKHVIYNYMYWHLDFCRRNTCPYFKTKDNNHLILNKNQIYNSEIYKAIKNTIKYKSFNEFILYMKEINKEIKKNWGYNTQFTVLVIQENGVEDWQKLKQEGINVIKLNDIIGFNINTKEYAISNTNDHPNEKAWKVIVPALVKELDL